MIFILTMSILGLVAGQLLNLAAAGVGEEDTGPLLAACSRCARSPGWRDFFPVAGWFLRAPQCPVCGGPRPYREVFVALLTAVLFTVAAVRLGPSFELARVLLGTLLILLVALADLIFWLMPFRFVLPGMALGLLTSWFSREVSFTQAFWGAVLSFVFLLCVELLAERAWGGDPLGGGVKFFIAMASTFLGAHRLPALLVLTLLQASPVAVLIFSLRGRASFPSEREPALLAGENGAEGAEQAWAPTETMIQMGPLIALPALELLFAMDFLRGVLPSWAVHYLLGG